MRPDRGTPDRVGYAGGGVASVPRQGFEGFARFVAPLVAERARVTDEPWELVDTDAGRLVTADGRRIEDLHGTQAFGHRNPAIGAAVRAFLEGGTPNWFPSRVNPFSGDLARRLLERAGGPYGAAYLAGSGSEAVESAIKLARAVTGRPGVLGLARAYHGCNLGSTALMSPGVFRDPFGPHLPGVGSLPPNDVDALRTALAGGDVAAVIVEPIQLEGGVRPLSPAYVEALGELTARHGTLLVADEVQTGLGRTGRFLASQVWPRRPDAVLLGKHLGGGLLPISAMLYRADHRDAAYGRDYETAEAHNSTFGGSALPCVAAGAALDLLTDELVAEVGAKGERFRASLRRALAGPLLAEVRGDGLAIGIELRPLDHPWLSFEHFGLPELGGHPTTGLLLCHRLYRRGWFAFVCGHDWSVLRLQPRFALPDAELDRFAAECGEELAALQALA